MTYHLGIDIGSTTVKLALLDGEGRILHSDYRRHMARTQETLCTLLKELRQLYPVEMRMSMTGSGALTLADALHVPFVQEVVAVASAISRLSPETDVAIELGGEDAKIIYLTGGLDERMNGVCAGGTGSFIDQMAALLKTDAGGLNELAKGYREIYPIAARCGVFSKTDIQPLINEGAAREDLAVSIFQAVVNQTISGLACGKPIRGHVAFLGGPLHYLSELRNAFIRTLHLTEETAIIPDNSHLYAAYGAAMDEQAAPVSLDALIAQLEDGVQLEQGLAHLPPLFTDQADYAAFVARHSRSYVPRASLRDYRGDCFLGIDAGSTTTKVALIGSDAQLLYSFYANNEGDPVGTTKAALKELHDQMPEGAKIVRSCATGYGEGLLQSAFCLDDGEVETIAHCKAAAFFDPKVDCVLDIGGQDMKCIRLKNGVVDSVQLNEACSSGCGSFLENFASSLGYTPAEFAQEALFAQAPLDLGTRCTVFMNSNVKQAQRQGAFVADISAGLAYSVIKNALFKVIKLADVKELGERIVVQGGTFHNHAVLRAFEFLTGVEVKCPDISGIMGAFGAALIARENYAGQPTTMLPMEAALALTCTTKTARCKGCTNHCMLTISTFPGGRRHITGNRCERGAGKQTKTSDAPNVAARKLERIFAYEPLPEKEAPRGVIGIPRVLNIYENYPFWATLLKALGFSVVLSPLSSRSVYEQGMASIPSESECYPAKLAHGHVQWLIDQGVTTILYPSVFYEHQEDASAKNNFNCPMVAANPENIGNNVEAIVHGRVRLLKPFMALTSEDVTAKRLAVFFKEAYGIPAAETRKAVHLAWQEQQQAKADIRRYGQEALDWLTAHHRHGVVLAGRPYHIDPEINHGIPDMIAGMGLAVLTEDCLPLSEEDHTLRVTDQWVYHSRLYRAAEYVCTRDDLDIIQLNSFGCGLDAVTTDQVSEIMELNGRLYTLLKIDEVNNLGAARIRIRSLISAIRQRDARQRADKAALMDYCPTEFTKEMRDAGYTILAPSMSPLHFDLIAPAMKKHGYNVVMLEGDHRSAIDVGLKYVNNDACYPSIITVGLLLEAVHSGKYDTNKLALAMTQTGGCCRASNYVGFIRRALDKAGLSHIPVLSVNTAGLEKHSGFKITLPLAVDVIRALVWGDLLMRCLYRVRPYEKERGSADRLCREWSEKCIRALTDKKPAMSYKEVCEGIVNDFDALPIHEDVRKPRVGIVGEILVKYMPLANNHLVELLENEGAEAVVPDLMDFFNYLLYNGHFKHEQLGHGWVSALIAKLGVDGIRAIRKPALEALDHSHRFEPPMPIGKVAELAKTFLSLGNQYGEGWFLTGEMIELIVSGTPNIVCIQPFACLPNHVVGKGVISHIRRLYPQANITAVDYDPGSSEANQLNRIRLMLAAAKNGK